MLIDRGQRVSDLYHRALARAPEERAAFLAEACKGDEALREEAESLLEFEPASARLLERPAVAVAAGATSATSMIDPSTRPPLARRTARGYKGPTLVRPILLGRVVLQSDWRSDRSPQNARTRH
jgi:serine/threonine-protein kinase